MELKNMVALVSRTGRHLQRYERGCRQVVGFVKHPSLSLSLSRDHPTYLHATMTFFNLLVHLQFSLGISFFPFSYLRNFFILLKCCRFLVWACVMLMVVEAFKVAF